jgi:hypothetical protein
VIQKIGTTLLADWLESLNAAIESAGENICCSSLALANQPLVKKKTKTIK